MKKKVKKQPKKQPKPTTIRDLIQDEYPDVELLFMSEKEYDTAIIGVCDGISVSHNPKVAYDYDKVIRANMKMGMSHIEAIEYFDYNQGEAYLGEHTPVFIKRIK